MDVSHLNLATCAGPNTAFKVGNMGTAISETKLVDKWAASKRTQVFQQYFASNCSLCLKTP